MSIGRRTELLVVECPDCEDTTRVHATFEEGTTEYNPDACRCGRVFDGTEESEDDEPPEPERERDDEYGRLEPWV